MPKKKWTEERETLPGRTVRVLRWGPYRVWKDDDVEHGAFACSVQHGRFENILGHARTLTGAKRIAYAAEREDAA